MADKNDAFNIKKNFIAFSLFLVGILLIIDIILRVSPETIKPGFPGSSGNISAVGHYHEFDDGSSYYIYVIFEENGDVYQCWYDEERWNQKKVTNYKGGYKPDEAD